MSRTNADKLRIFKHRFRGLTRAYGTFDPKTWRSWQVKQPVTDQVILDHLRGRQPLGLYLLVQDHTHALAVDFDDDDANPPMALLDRCRHYELPACLERSKRRGWHVWLFFEAEGVLASKARLVARMLVQEIDQPHVEIFPKQDALRRGEVGNFIYLPLFGRLVPEGHTVFVDPDDALKPIADQWKVLEQIEPIPETRLDELIELNDLEPPAPATEVSDASAPTRTYGLTPCMQRMLDQGVTAMQRVSCFRLAVQLKKAGMPPSMTITVLEQWASRNRPEEGKRTITPEEIREQTRWAYDRAYTAIGCDDPAVRAFHGPDCPCAVWSTTPAAQRTPRNRPTSQPATATT
ncbi:MAG: hypothetical protein WD534_15085 [Phycisphaeraceae bacterium]